MFFRAYTLMIMLKEARNESTRKLKKKHRCNRDRDRRVPTGTKSELENHFIIEGKRRKFELINSILTIYRLAQAQ